MALDHCRALTIHHWAEGHQRARNVFVVVVRIQIRMGAQGRMKRLGKAKLTAAVIESVDERGLCPLKQNSTALNDRGCWRASTPNDAPIAKVAGRG